MCSICGIVSVPAGSFGFGSDPGRRIGAAPGVDVAFDGNEPDVVLDDDERPVVLDGDVDFVDEVHAASAVPAARAPSPLSRDRRLSAASAPTSIVAGSSCTSSSTLARHLDWERHVSTTSGAVISSNRGDILIATAAGLE
jgi:hypothetical protein